MIFVIDAARRNWSPHFLRWFNVKNNPAHRDRKAMAESQDKGAAGGSRTDEELRHALARAVEDAERVISGSTLPLPFDADGAAADEAEDAEGVEEAETPFVM
jgi:hypothetical protein